LALLSVNSVSKSYKDKGDNDVQSIAVLSKVSFELEENNLCTLCGPSGSGKTTLLNMISGLDSPDEGEIYFEGKQIHTLDEKTKCALRTNSFGMIFQSPNLVSHLTALENALLPSMFSHQKGKEQDRESTRDRAVSLLESLGLMNKMQKLPSNLSEGERRRVSIARALVTRPKLILADEPTINLDSNNSALVLDLIKSTVRKDGGAAIVATHDEEVARNSDLVLRIKFGRLANFRTADLQVP
jgi:putative ABC transport system ATP-binding protein